MLMRRRHPHRCLLLLMSLAAGASAALMTGCGGDDPSGPARPVRFEVATTNLPPLPSGKGHYEAWIAFPEPDGKQPPVGSHTYDPGRAGKTLHGDLELIGIGTFRVGSAGEVTELDGSPAAWSLRLARDASDAAEAWISIEPEGDQDTIPSGLVLAGAFAGSAERGVANLSAGYEAVLDVPQDLNLGSLAGRYSIETLGLAGAQDATERSRIAEGVEGFFWQADGQPGLNLPPLDGEKLVYEGWLRLTASDTPRSTGRFLKVDSLDSDAGGLCTSGQPQVPGQCLMCSGPASCVLSGTAVLFVTLEPANDNDPLGPSSFVLLNDTIPAAHPPGVPLTANNVTAALPTATFVVNR